MADIRYVNPGILRLPPEREEGADQFKLATQMREFGTKFYDMPRPLVIEGAHGELQVYNGVTRATRAYLADRSMQIAVEVTAIWPEWSFDNTPTIADSTRIDF